MPRSLHFPRISKERFRVRFIDKGDDSMCKKCKDVIKICRSTWDESLVDIVVARRMADLLHIQSLHCRLCHFFYDMRWDTDVEGRYALYGFSFADVLRTTDHSSGIVFLAVVPEQHSRGIDEIRLRGRALRLSRKKGFITIVMNDALSQPKEELTFSGRLIYSDTLNYALIRHWLSIERSDVEDEQSDSNLETISINLVDIESRVVIRWPRWKPAFVALSYVWGNIGGTARDFQDKHGEEQLPERCSRTIEDAITVTKNLGYRYLWVDLYCMSRDPAVRREQIAQMGVIYKSAPVTIIAPGEDADYGLPGVSRPRNPQIFYQSKDLCMISMQLDPLHDLESSKYSTRGWTYQEKLFAHRSLVFMDDQVFMESPEELYAESFFAPLRWRTQSAPWARDRQLQIHSDLFDEQQYFDKKGGMAQRTNGAFHGPGYIGLFQRHVQQYTRRALSYDSDALNAFQAVLEKFEQVEHPIANVCGIPHMANTNQTWEFIFGFGLSWYHTNSTALPRRRTAFPSWSWAGWEGEVRWIDVETWDRGFYGYYPVDCLHREDHPPCSCGDETKTKAITVSTAFTVADTETAIVDELIPNADINPKPQTYSYQLLHITADCSSVTIRYAKSEYKDSKKSATAFLYDMSMDKPMLQSPVYLCAPSSAPGSSYSRLLAIKLGEWHLHSAVCEAHLLLVRESKEFKGHSERVGVVRAPLEWYTKQKFSRRDLILR